MALPQFEQTCSSAVDSDDNELAALVDLGDDFAAKAFERGPWMTTLVSRVDQGAPAPLRRALAGHMVETAYERGVQACRTGELIAAAQEAGFEVLITTDRNLEYQQNLAARNLPIVVPLTTSWPRIQRSLPAVLEAVDRSAAGGYVEVNIA